MVQLLIDLTAGDAELDADAGANETRADGFSFDVGELVEWISSQASSKRWSHNWSLQRVAVGKLTQLLHNVVQQVDVAGSGHMHAVRNCSDQLGRLMTKF